jgi:hypothetical protein
MGDERTSPGGPPNSPPPGGPPGFSGYPEHAKLNELLESLESSPRVDSTTPSGPGNGENVAFKFELVSSDGDNLGSIETAQANWQAGDELIGHGNTHYRVVSVIPLARIAEYVDDPIYGALEVELL